MGCGHDIDTQFYKNCVDLFYILRKWFANSKGYINLNAMGI